ncbi:MAG: TldD/PmbA family protein [Erysipelotrichaceae bacterium]|nr:TldD/PmbA family protein [Erysipelotrichaceae bacterium]
MLNYIRLFERAKEEGIEAIEIAVEKESNFSFQLFRSEIDSYKVSDSYTLTARGIYEGKFGYASAERFDKETVEYIISHIKENARLSTAKEEPVIFRGSKKYQKKSVFNRKFQNYTPEDKIALMKKLDQTVREKSDLIKEIQLHYSDTVSEQVLMNSYGLKLSSKVNYGFLFCNAIAVDPNGETKSGGDIKLFNDLKDLDIDKIAEKTIKDTVDQFGSKPCASGKYRAVFSPEAVASLLPEYLKSLSSEQVQKNSSLLAGKLDQRICSRKLTVTENPLQKNIFFRYFDDEGVATENKTLIKSGELKTYLYNLTTAAKDNTASTGNGYKQGGKVGIGMVNVAIKPGHYTEEKLIEKCGNGIYIDSVSGLHSGMNAQSGNFSLISQGWMIEDGKKGRPVSLITAAGNLFDLFSKVEAVGNNTELRYNSYQVPSLLIKSIQISGE